MGARGIRCGVVCCASLGMEKIGRAPAILARATKKDHFASDIYCPTLILFGWHLLFRAL